LFYRFTALTSKIPFNILSILGFPELTSDYREQTRLLKILNNFADELIKTRKENRSDDDWKLIYELLDLKIDGKLLSNDEIRHEVNSTIFGSHDTLRTTLSFVVYNLAKCPEKQQKVFEEIYEIIGKDRERDIDESDLSQMHYTEAFIKETMRLYSTFPYIGRKVSTEVTAGGYTFPKDAEIAFAPYLMGRSEKYFKNPLKFDPNRFLQKDSDPEGFVQFSLAPRKCIGRKYSFTVMKMFISKIVTSFELLLPKHHEKLILVMTPTL
jgi:cytochrome P450 family 4